MGGIIALILQVVGPLLAGWLKSWLESHLRGTAARLAPAVGFEPEEQAAHRLLEAAYHRLWFFQLAKRRLLAEMLHSVPPVVRAGVNGLDHDDRDALIAAAKAAE